MRNNTNNKNTINQLSKEAYNQFKNSLLGFEKTLTPMQAGRAEKTLHKLYNYEDFGILSEKEYIYRRITESGAKPNKEEGYQYIKRNRELSKPKTLYMIAYSKSYHAGESHSVFNEISKTGYDFASYVINNNLQNLDGLEAYLKNEIGAIQEAERKEEEEKEQVRKQAQREKEQSKKFNEWIDSQVENFENDDMLITACKVFNSKMPEGFIFADDPVQVKKLIVLIDNIDHPRALQALKERLHSHNKGSKAVFSYVTGEALPSTDKGTFSILDAMHKKRLQEKKEQEEKRQNGSNYNNGSEWVELTDEVAVSIVKRADGLFDVAVMTCWFPVASNGKWEIEEDLVEAREGLSHMQVYGYIEYEVKPAYL